MDKIKQIALVINKLNIKEKIKIIDDCKNQYSIRNLCQYLQLNRSTYYFLKHQQDFKLKPTAAEKWIWFVSWLIPITLMSIGLIHPPLLVTTIVLSIVSLVLKETTELFSPVSIKVKSWIKEKFYSLIHKVPFVNKRNLIKTKEQQETEKNIKKSIENLTSDKLETRLQTQYDILKQELDNKKDKNWYELINNETINHTSNNISENHIIKCNHKYQKICQLLIEFHSTRKGRIYGYLRIFSAFKEWLKQEKNIILNIELSIKQMRKIMKEHNIQGLKQTKNNYPKNKKNPNKWIPTMDKVNKDYKSTTSSNQIWSMDTKQINTKEGWLYLFVIIDFYSNNVVSYNIALNKSYHDLILPALEKISKQFSWNQVKNVILHSDNSNEFYCQDITKWAEDKQIILSKKQPYDIGGNVISENWFSHLSQEWLPKGSNQYLSINEAINDVNQYVMFYNYERIHSKFLKPPILQIKI